MDFIITFFRDILDGPLYIIVAIISGILICSCIGYMAEVSLNKKKAEKEYEESHADLSSSLVNQSENTIQTPLPSSNGSGSINQYQTVNQQSSSTSDSTLLFNPNVDTNQQYENVNSAFPEIGISQNLNQSTIMGGMTTSAINNIPIPGSNDVPNAINPGMIPPTVTQTQQINNNQ